MPDRAFAGNLAQAVHHIVAGHAARFIDNQEPIHLTTVADRACSSHHAMTRLPHQRQKLQPCLFLPEATHHGRCNRGRVLLFDAAHHHAKVPRLHHHAHALRRNRILDSVGQLSRQSFLHLQAPRKHLNKTGNLAQPDHLALWYVGHMHFAEERQHVVFAEREHLNVLDDHHLVVIHVEQGAAQHLGGVLVVSFGQEGHRLLHACGRSHKTVAGGVLAKTAQDLAIHFLGAELAQPFVNHCCPSNRLAYCNWVRHASRTPDYSPAYSKKLFSVSSTRTYSNSPHGSASFNKPKTALHKFSVVGTRSTNNGSKFKLV